MGELQYEQAIGTNRIFFYISMLCIFLNFFKKIYGNFSFRLSDP